MATNGIRLITPTSVNNTGGTATINAGGSVTFSGLLEKVSLNGVFTSTYDNYIINVRLSTNKTSKNNLRVLWRLAGTDNTTLSSYVSQMLRADATTVSGARTTANFGIIGAFETDSSLKEGFTAYVYGPGLAQPTAWRSVTVSADTSAGVDDFAGTHNQSTAYDGFTLDSGANFEFEGLIKVYGLVQ